MCAFAFVVIPFSYFFYEEREEEVSLARRIFGGCKYTVFLLVAVIVLLIVGLVLKVRLLLLAMG